MKEDRNILLTTTRRKANWIGHTLRKNCLLKHVIEGKIEGRIEVTGRRGRKGKQLLDALKQRRGCMKLKDEELDRALQRNRPAKGYGPVVRRSSKCLQSAWKAKI